MKTETINFKDFLKNDYKNKEKITNLTLYSSLLPGAFLTPSTWLSPPPLIATGYMIVIGTGAVLIIVSALEMVLARTGHVELADKILDFFKFVMPLIFIAALVYFVLSNPLFF